MRRPGPPPGRPTVASSRARPPRPAAARGPPAGVHSAGAARADAPAHGALLLASTPGRPLAGAGPAPRALPGTDAAVVEEGEERRRGDAGPQVAAIGDPTPASLADPPPTTPALAPPPARKFASFSPADAVSARLRAVRRIFPTADGASDRVILVTALTLSDAPSAADILVDSFADAMRTPAWARGSLGAHIEGYVGDHVRMVPRALLLGARLVPVEVVRREEEEEERGEGEGEGGVEAPPSPSADPLAADLSPAEAACPLVGVGELSFSETTRVRGLTLNPPPDGAYLCNMAVAPPARGCGVGAALLAAAEGAAVLGGAREVYLHLRDRDGEGPGGRLYARAGYAAAGRDPALLALVLAQDRRSLMRKRLW